MAKYKHNTHIILSLSISLCKQNTRSIALRCNVVTSSKYWPNVVFVVNISIFASLRLILNVIHFDI